MKVGNSNPNFENMTLTKNKPAQYEQVDASLQTLVRLKLMTISAVSVPFTYGALSSSSLTKTSSDVSTLVMVVSVRAVQTSRSLYRSLSSRSSGAVTTNSVVFSFTANGATISTGRSKKRNTCVYKQCKLHYSVCMNSDTDTQ